MNNNNKDMVAVQNKTTINLTSSSTSRVFVNDIDAAIVVALKNSRISSSSSTHTNGDKNDTTIINTTMTNIPITDKECKVKHKVIKESNHGSKGRQSKSDHNPTMRAPTLNGVDSNLTTIATTKGNEIISIIVLIMMITEKLEM